MKHMSNISQSNKYYFWKNYPKMWTFTPTKARLKKTAYKKTYTILLEVFNQIIFKNLFKV